MVTPTNHVIARAEFVLRGTFGILGDFRNIFLSHLGKDQKKSHHLSAGPPAGTQWWAVTNYCNKLLFCNFYGNDITFSKK